MSSLASRCPTCQTVFRVVPDQLRVSAGWVRCGRCAEVFNASEQMVDANTGEARATDPHAAFDLSQPDAQTSSFVPAPPMDPADAPDELPEIVHGEFVVDPYAPVHHRAKATRRPTTVPAATPAAAESGVKKPRSGRDRRETERAAAPTAAPAPRAPEAVAPRGDSAKSPPTEALAALQAFVASDALPQTEPEAEAEPNWPRTDEPQGPDSRQLDLPLEAPGAPQLAQEAVDIRVDAAEVPSFVTSADRAARWRRPWVRATLTMASLVAALLLAFQCLYTWRDEIAARSPLLQPLLAQACERLGCRLGAPRALAALRVESSGLLRVDRSDLYRVSVVLRNLHEYDVALPALELALTDSHGQLISRRVLRGTELGARVAALGAGAELTLQSTLQVAAGAVAGYTIELFYP